MRPTLKLTLALLLSVMATSALANEWVGVIKRSKGEVLLQRDSELIAAAAGTEIRKGDRLITGRDSYVKVTVRGASPVSVGPQANVALDRYIPKDEPVPHASMDKVLHGLASALTVNRLR